VKDELAGKKVRCPECSKPVQVPAGDAVGAEWDQWDDIDDASAAPPVAKKSRNGPKKKKKGTASGVQWGIKAIFGLIAIMIGAAIGIFICYSLFTGNADIKMARGLVMPVVFIGFGIAWIKGDTYGG
jgi:hypothetical protein